MVDELIEFGGPYTQSILTEDYILIGQHHKGHNLTVTYNIVRLKTLVVVWSTQGHTINKEFDVFNLQSSPLGEICPGWTNGGIWLKIQIVYFLIR